MESAGPPRQACSPVVADTADHVDPVDKNPARVPWYPVADRVIDRVTGRTADAELARFHIGDLGHIPDSLIALPYAVLAQQFALLASVECGLAPDNPFPSGELSRVVRGITIYSLPRPT